MKKLKTKGTHLILNKKTITHMDKLQMTDIIGKHGTDTCRGPQCLSERKACFREDELSPS